MYNNSIHNNIKNGKGAIKLIIKFLEMFWDFSTILKSHALQFQYSKVVSKRLFTIHAKKIIKTRTLLYTNLAKPLFVFLYMSF